MSGCFIRDGAGSRYASQDPTSDLDGTWIGPVSIGPVFGRSNPASGLFLGGPSRTHSGPSLAVSVLPMADRHKAPGALFRPISGHIPRAATVGHGAHLYPGLIRMHVHIERRGSSVQISSNSWRHMPFTSQGHSDRSLMKPPATRGTFLTCQHAIHACMQTVPVLEHRS